MTSGYANNILICGFIYTISPFDRSHCLFSNSGTHSRNGKCVWTCCFVYIFCSLLHRSSALFWEKLMEMLEKYFYWLFYSGRCNCHDNTITSVTYHWRLIWASFSFLRRFFALQNRHFTVETSLFRIYKSTKQKSRMESSIFIKLYYSSMSSITIQNKQIFIHEKNLGR